MTTLKTFPVTKLTASDAAANDLFGRSVAISGDGDTVIVGAPMEDEAGASSGSAYIFIRSGTGWVQQTKLTASEVTSYYQFGHSVAISGDGNMVIVGAIGGNGAEECSGSAYIFERSETSWVQKAELTASDGRTYDYFGCSVAISGDGDTVIVGAEMDDVCFGSVYIFKRNGTNWVQQDKLTASDPAPYDYFGRSVAISGDGNTVIVGASDEDSQGTDSGSAYIFIRSGTGWMQQAKFIASDTAAHDRFGCSVAMSSDGNTLIVGAYGDNVAGTHSGSAYIFKRSGTGWMQQAKLIASDPAPHGCFGWSVAISGDGDRVIVGHFGDEYVGTMTGSAYIFKRYGAGWDQAIKLTASDPAPYDYFGYSVGISENDRMIVGAWGDEDAGAHSGSSYVYEPLLAPSNLSQLYLEILAWFKSAGF